LSNISDISNGDPKTVVNRLLDQAKNKTETSGQSNIGPAQHTNAPSGSSAFHGSPEVPKWLAQQEQDLRDALQYVGMQINIDTLGLPDLLPAEVIALRGYGVRIDTDNYAIMNLTHTLGSNGFLTSFTAFKNVQGNIASEIAPPQAAGASSPTEIQLDDPNKVVALNGKEREEIEAIKAQSEKDKEKLIKDINSNKNSITNSKFAKKDKLQALSRLDQKQATEVSEIDAAKLKQLNDLINKIKR